MKNSSVNLFFLFLLFLSASTQSQFYPYTEHRDYKENYRGQFHFSPKSEWMNDINGLVYQGGKYHMIYQWAESNRGRKGWLPRFGGYASSVDLLHWTDHGIALVPQREDLWKGAVPNVAGCEVYSGSAVVVSDELAKKITGSAKEAIVTIYTGKCLGTCLAWSNDTGKSWHNYPGNPVAHPTKSDYPRDPCVKWHAPTQKYILALYENGTSFYGSKDLIHWDSLSNLKFGYECPDLIELPLDKNEKTKKWIIYDANGSYLVGDFDGISFTLDKNQDTLLMDVGPDFYAAQSFSAGNLPNNDKRIIQIAWMDHWNGGVGETLWERNATFPVSLGLVSDNGQKRITRNPIAEISNLYEKTKIWKSQTLNADDNILSDLSSKQFDLIAEFDLSKTKATKFGFKIAEKLIEYDIEKNTLMGKKLLPDKNNCLKIRLLIDWAQIEIFANNGVFSYTEQYGFDPKRKDIELFTDGEITLRSLEFHEMKGIW